MAKPKQKCLRARVNAMRSARFAIYVDCPWLFLEEAEEDKASNG